MRPGPTTEELQGPISIGTQLDIALAGRVLAADIPAREVMVEGSRKNVVPEQVKFQVPLEYLPLHPHDPVNNYGQEVRITSIIETQERRHLIPIGWFLITEWDQQENGVGVTAPGLLQILHQAPWAWPSSPPRGATISSELARIAGANHVGWGGLPTQLDAPDQYVPRSYEFGYSRTEGLRELMEAYGLDYAVKPDRILHAWPDETKPPVAHYNAKDLLIGAARKSGERRPNQWTVAGSPSGDDSVRWSHTTTHYDGPYHPDTYGIVTDRREFNAATTAAAVAKAADTYKRKDLAAKSVRSLSVALDPRIELGDVVSAIIDQPWGQETLVGKVVAYSMPLDDVSGVMRLDVEEVAW